MPVKDTGLTAAGIRSEFFDRLSSVQTFYQDLTTRIASNKELETYAFLGSVPPMREWGTGRLARGLFTESYQVVNGKYESTLEVDRDELDDDQTGQIRIRIGEMATRAAQHKDALLAALLVNGASAGFNSYDGQIYFSAAHASGLSGTQDNTLAPAIVDKDAPTSAEFRAAFASAVARMLGFVDDQGEPMSMAATSLVCVVPPSMYVAALEALNATMIGSTTNVLQGAARIIAFSRLTDTDTWYLLKTDGTVRPLIFQDRMPIEFTALEQNSDEGFRREKFLYGIRARYTMTYGYWQYATRIAFTTA